EYFLSASYILYFRKKHKLIIQFLTLIINKRNSRKLSFTFLKINNHFIKAINHFHLNQCYNLLTTIISTTAQQLAEPALNPLLAVLTQQHEYVHYHQNFEQPHLLDI